MPFQLEIPETFNEELAKSLKDVYIQAIQEAKRDVSFFKEFLTISEAAEYVSVSKNTFLNNYLKNNLPQYRIESKTYVKKSELKQFIENHRI